jgi:molybdopterin molybdotransferase
MSEGMLSFDEACARLLAAARPLSGTETVDTLEADGRVLAGAQRSGLDVPPLDMSAMDGYAVRCADVPRPGTRLPLAQRIPAGSVGRPLAPATAARIFTGAPVPDGADSIVMQELCQLHAGEVEIGHLPRPGEWIRRAGEDIRRGAEVLAAGVRLQPQHLGLAASVGLAALPVRRRVRLALFFTGDELAMPGEPLAPGAIYNSNRYLLRALARRLGCEVADLGRVPDRLDATRAALRQAAQVADVIVSSGGVSVGEEDHVRAAVAAEGELALWKIAIKPGKPLAFGRVGDAAFVGLPGNPVSSLVTFVLLVRPFVLRLAGVDDVLPRALLLRADFDWPQPDRRREFLRTRRNARGGLDLFPNQSSAVLSSVAWGDGLVDNPPGQAIGAGDEVRFLPFSELF